MPDAALVSTPSRMSREGCAKIAPSLAALVRPVAELHEDPENARAHPETNLDAIQKSLETFGQQKPIVVDGAGVVIAGNGTLRAARALGWTHLACVTTDLAGEAARGYAIADSRTGELAVWDMPRLAEILTSLPHDLASLAGFSDDDLRRVAHEAELAIRALQAEADVDAVPAPPAEATTRRGDLWVLGRHRLLCGDAGSAADLDRLLAGAPVHLVHTDPPYNVKVDSRSNNAIAAGLSSFAPTTLHHQGLDLARHPGKAHATHPQLRPKDRPLENDFLDDDEFERRLRDWFGNMARVLIPGGAAYVWGGYANIANYPAALKAAGLYMSQTIIWNKLHPVLTRKDYMGAHEWCMYSWKEGAAHRFFGPNNVPDLWEVKKVAPQHMIHLTEKPVELAERAITYSSLPGENVLDLFGGSGSTLIAAERTGRNAYLMEIDGLYADVIVARWEQLTGQKATREGAVS